MKILVIQQKMIGDVLTSTIICQQLKAILPKCSVHYLVNAHTTPVVEGNPNLDKLVVFTKAYRDSKKSFYTFLKKIENEGYDVVIDVYAKLESNLISIFSRAPKRISDYKWYTAWLYTHTFKPLKNQESSLGLAIENRLRLLEPIITPDKIKAIPPKIYLTTKELQAGRSFLIDNQISLSKPLFMIGILGSGASKTYPIAFMAKLLDQIVQQCNATLLFNYIPTQKTEAEALFQLCGEKTKKQVRLDVFAHSLRQFLTILAHCNAMIGNEGGAVHMAKALQVPNFAIFSPWISKSSWFTFGNNPNNWAVHLKDKRPELFAGKTQKQLKKESTTLYQEFLPAMIAPNLQHFITDFH